MNAAMLSYIGGTGAIVLACFAFLRGPKCLVHRSFAGGMIALGLAGLFGGLSLDADSGVLAARWQNLRFIAQSCMPVCWLLFSLTYARADSSQFIKRWKPALVFAGFLPAITIFCYVYIIHLFEPVNQSAPIFLALSIAGYFLQIYYLITLVVIGANLECTLKASVGTKRWQIKYMIVGLGLILGVEIVAVIQILLNGVITLDIGALNAAILLVGGAISGRSLLRGRMEKIDIYLSNQMLIGSVTVLLVGLYLLAVGLLTKVVERIGGIMEFPFRTLLQLAALAGLIVLLLSDHARRAIRLFVSYHFRRPQYDYRQVWSNFTSQTASLTQVNEICRVTTELVSETFGALSTTVWLTDEMRGRFMFGASTALSTQHPADSGNVVEDFNELVGLLSRQTGPFDIEEVEGMETIRRRTPIRFSHGGSRLCVPLAAGGRLLGFMTLGDRVGGRVYSVEERELLRTLGDQVAASLLNIRLAERLAQGREMEAFQTMSAFFVHDLKNIASTLALMLQNLPRHFGDPAFRDDALRAIAKSATQINEIISRLTMLRRKKESHRVAVDINALVKSVLNGMNGELRGLLTVRYGTVPLVPIDSDQIRGVIINLVNNARDAIGETNGHITVETLARPDGVKVVVTDTGAGMSADFIEERLFRPFQTTKKQGIGIGLFQCKAIVDAHGGQIDVTSRIGAGTTFRIFLPTYKGNE